MKKDAVGIRLRTLANPPPGVLSPFSCPDCGGAMWETQELDLVRFRCHVGHAFSDEVLVSAQAEAVENALWAALRALEEKAELARRLARRARQAGDAAHAHRQERDGVDAEQQASMLYALLTAGRVEGTPGGAHE